MKTKERLAAELEKANAPEWMIKNARNGQYDDFESSSGSPIMQLVSDCSKVGLTELAIRAADGEFDATKEEAEAWYQREGKSLLMPEPPVQE